MEHVSFDYRIQDGSWAEVVFAAGSSVVTVVADCASKPLDQLISAALSIARDQPRVELYLTLKNGYSAWWTFDLVPDGVRIRVIEIRRADGGQSGGQLFNESCSVHALCLALAEGGAYVHDRHGINGYRSKSGTAFPVGQLTELEAVVEKPT